MFELTEEQRKQLLQYMWTRPYGEVATLVGMLASLKTLAFLALLIYWSVIITGTFLQ